MPDAVQMSAEELVALLPDYARVGDVSPKRAQGGVVTKNALEGIGAEECAIRYMGPVGMRWVKVACTQPMTVKELICKARLHDSILRSVNTARLAKVIGQTRVRLSTTIKPGELLRLNPISRPFF